MRRRQPIGSLLILQGFYPFVTPPVHVNVSPPMGVSRRSPFVSITLWRSVDTAASISSSPLGMHDKEQEINNETSYIDDEGIILDDMIRYILPSFAGLLLERSAICLNDAGKVDSLLLDELG
jgi:hypothetical protein